MTHLYEISDQIRSVKRLFDADFIDEQAMTDTLDSLDYDLTEKAENLLKYVANIGGDVDSLDKEIKRLQKRKSQMVNRQNSLRDYLRFNMEKSGVSKIDCPLFAITLRKPSIKLQVLDASEIPDKYVNVQYVPDKKMITKELKDGGVVTGCQLVEGKTSLLIR